MLAQSSSSLLNLLQTLNPDALAAVCILGTVGTFASVIIAFLSVTSTIKNISMMKMSQTMARELLEKGYSVDDIERLVHAGGWNRKFDHNAGAAQRTTNDCQSGRRPLPPLKQPA